MTCNFSSHVDRHFSGSIDPRSEHALREHLPDCESCRTRYERRMLLERLDPRARGAESRLGRGLGIRPVRAPWLGLGLAAAAVATAAFVLAARPTQMARVNDGAWQTRGNVGGKVTKSTVPELQVFKLRPGEPSRPVREWITNKDELAFAYRNPGDAKYLMVFGIDEHKHVYWYHPAWLNPEKKPVAVKISSDDDAVHELPEAIAHPLDGQKLDIVAVFAPRAVSVTEIEQKVAERGADAPLGIGVEARTRLRVEK
jgi:hypothetical protein